MTPKEKAWELNQKYMEMQHYLENDAWNNAKQCALIAVDEMLNWFKAHSYSNKNYDAFVFYNEVKKEIENL
jgi:hypothetical protein